jgi:hypothetical protein
LQQRIDMILATARELSKLTDTEDRLPEHRIPRAGS